MTVIVSYVCAIVPSRPPRGVRHPVSSNMANELSAGKQVHAFLASGRVDLMDNEDSCDHTELDQKRHVFDQADAGILSFPSETIIVISNRIFTDGALEYESQQKNLLEGRHG